MIVRANLDCEWQAAADAARRAGRAVQPLPHRVRERLSLLGTLLRVFAQPGDTLLTPGPVPARCVRPVPELPEVRLGIDEAEIDTDELRAAWATAHAAPCLDRAFGFTLGQALGTAPRASTWIACLDELADVLPADSAWVLKAPLSAAGRDRVRGTGRGLEGDLRPQVERLLAFHGRLLLEPWVERTADFGYGTAGRPHSLEVDGRGRFRGILLPGASLSEEERAQVARVRTAVRAALAAAGHGGAWGVDAWRYEDEHGRVRFQPLGELNARMTFGAVARALHEQVAASRWGADCASALRFGTEAEHRDARTVPLLGDEAGRRMFAWLERLPTRAPA